MQPDEPHLTTPVGHGMMKTKAVPGDPSTLSARTKFMNEIMNEMTWNIENNWMTISFFHPSRNTPEDTGADKRFAMMAFTALQATNLTYTEAERKTREKLNNL